MIFHLVRLWGKSFTPGGKSHQNLTDAQAAILN